MCFFYVQNALTLGIPKPNEDNPIETLINQCLGVPFVKKVNDK